MKIEDIARHYMAASSYEMPSSVAKGFHQFVIELAQVELEGTNVQYVDFQPYLRGSDVSLDDLCADANQGNIQISTQFNESNLLNPEVNLIFRSIHEMHHVKLKMGFDWQGESACARCFMSCTENVLFQQILFSEFLGQAAVRLYTGKFPDAQKVVLFEPDVIQSLLKG